MRRHLLVAVVSRIILPRLGVGWAPALGSPLLPDDPGFFEEVSRYGPVTHKIYKPSTTIDNMQDTIKVPLVKDNGLLAPFIGMLKDKGLVDFDIIRDNDDVGLESRIRLQKYVFIAKQFGLEMGYEYNMYKYGPYSPGLAGEYYRLAWDPEAYDKEVRNELPHQFQRDDFLNVVTKRDTRWLEVASTMINKLNYGDDIGTLVDETAWIKRRSVGPDFVRNVFDDLHNTRPQLPCFT